VTHDTQSGRIGSSLDVTGGVAMFSFTSLLGAKSTSSASSSLLELEGGVKILIDVGWDETFDGNLLAELEKYNSLGSFRKRVTANLWLL